MSEYRCWLYFLAFGLLCVAVANIVLTGRVPGVPPWAHWLAACPLGGSTVALFLEAGDRHD